MAAQAKVERARDLFLSGANCAQAVLTAFAPELGMEEKQTMRLSCGLGGGVGGNRLVCGALSAACVVAGILRGYDDPSDTEGKKALYAMEQAMAARFVELYGTTCCRELLERNGVEAAAQPSERTPEYYKTRPCAKYVEACARILAEALQAPDGSDGKTCE